MCEGVTGTDELTGARLIWLIGVPAVVAVAAHTNCSSLRRGAAVRGTLQAQTWTLGGLEGTRWTCCRNREEGLVRQR